MDRRVLTGLLLGLAAAVIGGAWQVVTRHSTTTSIAAPDLAILRYAIPALLLLPLSLRIGLIPRGAARGPLALLVLGAGLPFGVVAMSGSQFAPAAHMGVLMAGASPLMAAALSWALWRERPGGWRLIGLALMALGVLLLGAHSLASMSSQTWRGDLLFLLAALLWALFTLAFRHARLTPWQAAAVVNSWSALLLLPWLIWRGGGHLLEAPAHDLLFQAVWQGLIAGLLGLWTFSGAIVRLGASRAAAFGALTPAISALGGWWWLGDVLTPLNGAAVLAAMLGVALASGAIDAPSLKR